MLTIIDGATVTSYLLQQCSGILIVHNIVSWGTRKMHLGGHTGSSDVTVARVVSSQSLLPKLQDKFWDGKSG